MIKAAHMKLSHSRMPFVRAYFRETQELVFDAHDKAFQFYGGVCRRGIYDNMKTAVEAIFVGKARQYNRRFLQMCSHHLIEPVACTPASGWEKGQVENQVGNLRDQLFRPNRLENRFQHNLGGGLNHPIPDRRDAEGAFAASRLWDHHPPHRFGPIRLRDEVLTRARQPHIHPRRVDLRESHPVHARHTRIVASQRIVVVKNVPAANLVVEQIEAKSGLRLRLAIELLLKVSDAGEKDFVNQICDAIPIRIARPRNLEELQDRVEIFRQIGVNNVGIAPANQPVRFLDRIDRGR